MLAKRLANILPTNSVWTIRRILNPRYLQPHKKAMLTSKDSYKRLKLAQPMKPLSPYFWKLYISFYFDGTLFAHKTNPYDSARTVKSHAWRRQREGLALHCTSKDKKSGFQGKVVHFFATIT